jgi:hypothetical protein
MCSLYFVLRSLYSERVCWYVHVCAEFIVTQAVSLALRVSHPQCVYACTAFYITEQSVSIDTWVDSPVALSASGNMDRISLSSASIPSSKEKM